MKKSQLSQEPISWLSAKQLLDWATEIRTNGRLKKKKERIMDKWTNWSFLTSSFLWSMNEITELQKHERMDERTDKRRTQVLKERKNVQLNGLLTADWWNERINEWRRISSLIFTALPLVKLYVGGILSLLTVVEACSDDIFNSSLLRKWIKMYY